MYIHRGSRIGQDDEKPQLPDDPSRVNDRSGEQLERAADLRVREAAEATHEQQRVDADRLQPGDLLGDLAGRAE
jgi:hypothetical protein